MMKEKTKQKNEIKIKNITLLRQGEGLNIGRLVSFIAFCGNNVVAQHDGYNKKLDFGSLKSIEEVIKDIEVLPAKLISLGGGEPLIQKEPVIKLCEELIEKKYDVELRTNSTINWKGIPKKVLIDMNLYSPSMVAERFNNYDAIKDLTKKDQLKMYVTDKRDYEWVTSVMNMYKPYEHTNVFFLPIGLYARQLYKWSAREPRVRVMLRNLKVVQEL